MAEGSIPLLEASAAESRTHRSLQPGSELQLQCLASRPGTTHSGGRGCPGALVPDSSGILEALGTFKQLFLGPDTKDRQGQPAGTKDTEQST